MSAEYQFSSDADWVSPHEDNWKLLIDPYIRMPVRVIEVGCWEGRSAIWWLDNLVTHPDSTLTLIDPCTDTTRYSRLLHNLSCHSRAGQVSLYRSSSHRSLATLPDDSFDFIYIDGSHEGKDVLLDGCLAFRKLRIGGTILFDDYLWNGQPHFSREILPRPAIDAFITIHHPWLRVTHDGYQFAVHKTS